MTFNIGSQNAGQITNVAGDMHVTGGLHGSLGTVQDARQAARDLRRSVERAGIGPHDRGPAAAEVDEIDAGLRAEEPDRRRVAGALERLTRVLASAGALATAATSLLDPLRALAMWLGELGTPVLQMLG